MGRTRLVHRTAYSYEHPVLLGPQVVRLRPMPDPRVVAAPYSLVVTPMPGSLHWQMDALGNQVARLVLTGPVRELVLEVVLELALVPRNPFDFLLDPEAAAWPFRYEAGLAGLLEAYRQALPAGERVDGLRQATSEAGETVSFVLGLGAAVVARVGYEVREEAGVWTGERTLAEGRGSCRDSAWLLVQLLRLHGIAARFVSGYLVQMAEGEAGHAVELHAWAEAYLPGAGWVGIDATSGLLTGEGHIALAAGPDPEAAAPLTGTVEPGAVRLETSIQLVALA